MLHLASQLFEPLPDSVQGMTDVVMDGRRK
jgi:hypothetical protein